ncbi:MAG: hypothetical protein DMD63_06710 [Gemmatimonadetes bacterium]|nr:MAG: hypothetical protein DMD63_06710 [Gemmatimonadota bacterium]
MVTFFRLMVLSKPTAIWCSFGDLVIVADGSQNLQIINRFEEIRLAVAVVADKGDAFGRELEIYSFQISEVTDRDALEPNLHFPLKAKARPSAFIYP